MGLGVVLQVTIRGGGRPSRSRVAVPSPLPDLTSLGRPASPTGPDRPRPHEVPAIRQPRPRADLPTESLPAPEASLESTWIRALPQVAAGRWLPLGIETWPLKWRRSARVLAFDLRYRDRSGEAEGTLAGVAKQYADGAEGSAVFEALDHLRRGGFRPPAAFLVSRPLCFDAASLTLVQERALGEQWIELVLHGEGWESSSRTAAAWLTALHATPGATPSIPVAADAERVLRLGRRLQLAYIEAGPVAELAQRLALEMGRPAPLKVPSHGDFHPKNLVLVGDQATGIDLDGFASREPAADLGDGIGQLLSMSEFRTGSPTLGARAAAAFWAGYVARTSHVPSPERVGVYVARTFVQALCYALCHRGSRRTDLLRAWPAQARRWLAGEGAEVLGELVEVGAG